MNKNKILIVDDQLLIRKGITNILSAKHCQYNTYEASSMKEAIEKAFEIVPDLILMDLQLGDGTGADACRIIKDKYPKTKILFLSMFDDRTSILAALLSGAAGYIPKSAEPKIILNAILLTLQGYALFSQKSIPYMLSHAKNEMFVKEQNALSGISSQQNKVLEYVSQGLTNKEIGKKMHLSDKTVRNYLTIIFEKLGITKRTEAAVIYTKSKP